MKYGFVLQHKVTKEFLSPVLWARQDQRRALAFRTDADDLRIERVRVVPCTRRKA